MKKIKVVEPVGFTINLSPDFPLEKIVGQVIPEALSLKTRRIKHDRKVIADLKEPILAHREIIVHSYSHRNNNGHRDVFDYTVCETATRAGIGVVEIGRGEYTSLDLGNGRH